MVGRPTFEDFGILGFERILKQIVTYGNIHYVEISTVGLSTRMHCIYENLDLSIYYKTA